MFKNHPNEKTVSQRFYQTVFTRDYNIVCQAPKTDVCITCEIMRMQNKKELGQDVAHLELQLEQLEKAAKLPRDLLKTAEAEERHTGQSANTKIVAIDLQQTLPCPRL